MKIYKSLIIILLSFAFLSTLRAQTQPAPQPAPQPSPAPAPAPAPSPQPAPAPTPAPQPAPAPQPKSGEIPIIKMGEIKPEKPIKPEKVEGAEETPRPARVKRPPAPRAPEVPKSLTLESKQFVHSRVNEVGEIVVFAVADGPAKGSLVNGTIAEIVKMDKNQPARLRINLETLTPGSPTTVEVVREGGKDSFGGKDVFMAAGYRQSINLSKKGSLRLVKVPPKPKPIKGLLTSSAAVERDTVSVKLGTLKYPLKLNIYIEAPAKMAVADISEETLRLIRVNDFNLPKPVAPTGDKIKVADHDKNNIQELNYKFDGWEVIQYLPEGSSLLVFSASTKDGKPIEAVAKVTTEYR